MCSSLLKPKINFPIENILHTHWASSDGYLHVTLTIFKYSKFSTPVSSMDDLRKLNDSLDH